MPVPAAFVRHAARRAGLLLRRGLDLDPAPFLVSGPEELRRRTIGEVGGGRGGARRLDLAGRPGIWRQNRHGGFAGTLLGARYLGSERLEDEVELSETLLAHGIPTPEVLLALAWRPTVFWEQHLVTAEVEDAVTVFAAGGEPAAAAAARELIEELFRIGLWAPDLHPGNLLWQSSARRVWLIDLAGCRLLGRPLTESEQAARRSRFLRYFRKHAGAVPPPWRGWA
ncbi:MAG: hypothetical protein D6702_09060 [Planctomycetota bacterium]|nr:MAG: hypothetical protein D6702_09060 [Planctomycetota bacterium]